MATSKGSKKRSKDAATRAARGHHENGSSPGDAPTVRWILDPEEHDYPAAESYLCLLTDPEVAHGTVIALREASPEHFKAKDILRSARLALLPLTNPHVASDLRKIADGTPLSPVLMVRGDLHEGRPALIADGYHRVCASYLTDENTDIPVRIVDPTRR
ncbi:hypothetical protein [Raineyella sp. LH-20]|uniref:hypothetical protein n=1 Tax=Raineyella sp. LH-20 TaxID=3081204 RepID=UPI002954BB8E|nr:hypothetical protein [Raineyella sp. LH-20]WOP20014.1 hypothetical protein R0146_07000 [Raineyella sp. LH-20]